MELTAGKTIGERYRLVAELGGGGMGVVWYAEDGLLSRPVALKLLRPSLADSSDALRELAARFALEAIAVAKLRTKHTVQVWDRGEWQGQHYIAMELLNGEDLSGRLERVGRLSPREVSRLLTQVGRAIQEAHRQGIVHRDLKPANIFIARDPDTDEEIAKVLDFGIAKALASVKGVQRPGTRQEQILGTPEYMSPEQLSNSALVDTRTDIWALGVIAFEALTGRHPFEGDTYAALAMAICYHPPPVPSEYCTVPAGFNAWFAQTTARIPEERFQSVEACVAALRFVCEGGAETSEAIRSPSVDAGATPTGEPPNSPPEACGNNVAATCSVAPTTTRALSSVAVASRPAPERLRWGWVALGACCAGMVVAAFTFGQDRAASEGHGSALAADTRSSIGLPMASGAARLRAPGGHPVGTTDGARAPSPRPAPNMSGVAAASTSLVLDEPTAGADASVAPVSPVVTGSVPVGTTSATAGRSIGRARHARTNLDDGVLDRLKALDSSRKEKASR